MKVGVLAATAVVPLAMTGTAYAAIPIGQNHNGNATFYTANGTGACGDPVNASTQMLAAVPKAYWTTANPNNDPICTGISVQVTYKGKTVTVPVRDRCPSCDPSHIDLSKPAFAVLADTDLGKIHVSWKFVRS
jgi:expansin (peptidoglycan-binding protein)